MPYSLYSTITKTIALISLLAFSACQQEGGSNEQENQKPQDIQVETVDPQASVVSAQQAQVTTTTSVAEKQSGAWGDIIYGDQEAAIEIIEYASLTCPHCATFAAQTFPQLKKEYIDTGKVRLVFRNFILNRIDLAASTIARCGNHDQAKIMTKNIFAKQSQWARSKDPIGELAAIARRSGVSRVEVDRCLSNIDMHEHLVKMTRAGQKDHKVNAVPTVIVDGVKLDHASYEKIVEAIERAR